MLSPIKLEYQQENAKLRCGNISRQTSITGCYETARTPEYLMKNLQIWWPMQFTAFSERIGNERSENRKVAVKIKKRNTPTAQTKTGKVIEDVITNPATRTKEKEATWYLK
ncbi:hypothetical protein MCOR32_011256 [Pyricularia oryzae]|nr:hypothetical protein MCOR32_011256 [Pyricularia oryzae]